MLGVRSLFWECGEGAIAIWGCGSAIAFGDVGMRSLLGFRGAIAVLGMWGCDRFWDVGMRSLLGCGSAIAKRSGGITCWGVEVR